MEFLQLYAIGFTLGFTVSLAAQLWYFAQEYKNYTDAWYCYFDADDALIMAAAAFVGGVSWFLTTPIILLAGLLYFIIKLIRERKE